jgi:hypothetical protein
MPTIAAGLRLLTTAFASQTKTRHLPKQLKFQDHKCLTVGQAQQTASESLYERPETFHLAKKFSFHMEGITGKHSFRRHLLDRIAESPKQIVVLH